LREILYKQLVRKNLLDLAKEDFKLVTKSKDHVNNKPNYTGVRGYSKLSGTNLAVLDELSSFREEKAEQANLPPFKIIGGNVLLEIAKNLPSNERELEKTESLSKKLFRRHGKELLNAVKKGLNNEPIHVHNHAKPSDAYISRLNHLKTWRTSTANKESVMSDVILPRDILELIAKKNPQTENDLEKTMRDTPERFKRYHKRILRILTKEGK
jgi:ribonuclease D